MTYTAKITDVKKEVSLETNEPFLDVWFDILADGVVVADRRLAFPLTATEDEITEAVSNYCRMYKEDYKLAAEVQERSEAEAAADQVAISLKNKEISAPEEKSSDEEIK